MSADVVQTSYTLAPDVRVERTDKGAVVRTPISDTPIGEGVELETVALLDGTSRTEADLHAQLRLTANHDGAEARCDALLYRLDRLGLLTRMLSSGERRLASCVPLRPASGAPPDRPPAGLLRLSANALARTDGDLIALEKPGAWARLRIHERDLLPLLHDLAIGRPAAAMSTAIPSVSAGAVSAILALVSWCDLLDGTNEVGWATHELLFHTRTRRGYSRVVLGKSDLAVERSAAEPEPTSRTQVRIPLEPPEWPRLLVEDPPHALVGSRRRSIRRQGTIPITSTQLSEFLFRTLREIEGRRPYPSGGGCYPLNAYIAIHRCSGIKAGLYLYSPTRHDLLTVRETGPEVEHLLADAAAAANVDGLPQILVVLAARFDRISRWYGDLSYSLIVKEAGAVFQTAMMAAAAMGLAACPLGCGDSQEFSALAGVSPLVETSVGEMILGSLDES